MLLLLKSMHLLLWLGRMERNRYFCVYGYESELVRFYSNFAITLVRSANKLYFLNQLFYSLNSRTENHQTKTNIVSTAVIFIVAGNEMSVLCLYCSTQRVALHVEQGFLKFVSVALGVLRLHVGVFNSVGK